MYLRIPRAHPECSTLFFVHKKVGVGGQAQESSRHEAPNFCSKATANGSFKKQQISLFDLIQNNFSTFPNAAQSGKH